MQRIERFLGRLDRKRRARVGEIVARIVADDLSSLDVKKLKGSRPLYRVRVGDIRIIFEKGKSGSAVLAIEWRSDTTYKRA